jgi:hypothetical protein
MHIKNHHPPRTIELPLGLMAAVPWLNNVVENETLYFVVPANYEDLMESARDQSEVLGIQRLLTLAKKGAQIEVFWDKKVIQIVRSSAAIFPLLAVLLLLKKASHFASPQSTYAEELTSSLKPIRKTIRQHQLKRDFFADSDSLICDDASGESLPVDLYNPETQKLHSREDFEILVVDVLAAQLGNSINRKEIYNKADSLGVIVAELFENTDMHGRLDLLRKPLLSDSLRGILFKRILMGQPLRKTSKSAEETGPIECFEISVFDAGLGYFSSYMRQAFDPQTQLNEEWRVLHNCLERHYFPELVDHRAGHRGLGLYEVLRALQTLKGRIEIRTGRLFAYRTFFDGELQPQMQPRAEFSHFAWPKPRLLDVEKKYLARPSEHELLIGSSVRIIIPLR